MYITKEVSNGLTTNHGTDVIYTDFYTHPDISNLSVDITYFG